MNLRDHDRSCEHGNIVEHYIDYPGGGSKWCPGGREVTVELELTIGTDLVVDWSHTTPGRYALVRLGDTE